jgi:hypothetical protein
LAVRERPSDDRSARVVFEDLLEDEMQRHALAQRIESVCGQPREDTDPFRELDDSEAIWRFAAISRRRLFDDGMNPKRAMLAELHDRAAVAAAVRARAGGGEVELSTIAAACTEEVRIVRWVDRRQQTVFQGDARHVLVP